MPIVAAVGLINMWVLEWFIATHPACICGQAQATKAQVALRGYWQPAEGKSIIHE